MKNKIKLLEVLRFLSPITGFVMYIGTVNAFGAYVAAFLSVAATIFFAEIVLREKTRIIGSYLSAMIKGVLVLTGNEENVVEIKPLRSRLILRVYLIKADKNFMMLKDFIVKTVETTRFSKYIIAMQISNLNTSSEISVVRDRMDENLVEKIMDKK